MTTTPNEPLHNPGYWDNVDSWDDEPNESVMPTLVLVVAFVFAVGVGMAIAVAWFI